ncbi:ubiquitin-like-conjugating enzyme ATG10 [Stegastes partitus]|uniref:Ubiquitin-like-conjugating enzyme ATG10 n=1 Tax=Stegastes partitus TaxID=144197 RepID=A0A3B4ZNX9_9TELE|nr:PREDICTED: ubiquitin-like-conjugating enzyme ATG10 [Stegastes partitus]XP_008289137.1 PREDICTED: ubiquitin-like-conjugating enzyme ATG10 [Stegastes partitus]XP_008289138.1 PREDICTED: ubiquitin-like-conjugating enzyme ATG10 [Stegastes partitus]
MSWFELNEEKFHHCCQLILQQSEQLSDGWIWEVVQGSKEGYLRKTALRSVTIDSKSVQKQKGSSLDPEPHTSYHSSVEQQGQEDEQPDCIKDDIDDEDAGICMMTANSSQVLQFEYHILYSCSYSSPVLYFRAFTLEGRSLTLEEVWNSVHPNFRLCLQNSPLDTITQQEHPLLGQPFFVLHPCRTKDFMRPVLQAAQDQHRPVNYVLSWLSVVGPVVGLDVPLKYSTQLHPAASLSSTEPD